MDYKKRLLKIINWFCYESIEGEHLQVVEIPNNDSDNSQERWIMDYFGGCIPSEIEGGKYLCYCRNDLGDWVHDGFGYIEPDGEVEINGGDDYIYLYRID